eukprot:15438251-Alexandrium_andersonii.AAC.1
MLAALWPPETAAGATSERASWAAERGHGAVGADKAPAGHGSGAQDPRKLQNGFRRSKLELR